MENDKQRKLATPAAANDVDPVQNEARFDSPDEIIRYAICQSWLGATLAAVSESGVVAILLGDDEASLARNLQKRFPNARLVRDDAFGASHLAEIVAFIETPVGQLDQPMDVRGNDFQKRVWKALRDIPAGELLSYSDVAKCVGSPYDARAVASACAANNLAVAIPCHRVVYSDGRYGGYAWGVKRKQRLIEREVVPVWGLF
jgi:AraC family transcriptional regulator of adaptative response/methylated-DNA-[protein]-cysteine methyltransferase